MATSTYTPLYTTTISGTSTSSVSITIPAGYTDLRIVFNGSNTVGGTYALFGQLNSDTGSNYSSTRLTGNGSAASSSRTSSQNYLFFGWTSSGTQGTITVDLMNYSNATTYKTTISRGNDTAGNLGAFVNLWRNTAAITSLTLISESASNFSNGSTFSLYGISAAPSAKATGGMITSDATYYYHTFTSTGTFTPTQSLSADVLVIAGGASGGRDYAAGGGAGGVCYQASRSLTTSGYTVTVGAGGTAPTTGGALGGAGSNSVFDTITSNGGGGGGNYRVNGAAGGSGGGGGSDTGTGGATNQSTSGGATGYGFGGGNGGSSNGGTGGGGGAGAVGGNGSSTTTGAGGVGGAGLNTWSSWATATGTGSSGYYAGGGGGGSSDAAYGAGGAGGGGNGGRRYTTQNQAGSGSTNTGSGGGGGPADAGSATYPNPGAGGSGIVIVRYAK